jgi:hypothetical protein
MIQTNASLKLQYGGENKSVQVDLQSSSTDTISVSRPVGLVDQNQTVKDYNLSVNYDRDSAFVNTASSETKTSKTKQQTVLHSYYLESSGFNPSDAEYIEKQDYRHVSTVHTQTKEAQITAETTLNKTGNKVSATKVNVQPQQTTFEGVDDTGLVENGKEVEAKAETQFLVSFNNDQRKFKASDHLHVYKKILSDCSQNRPTALRFDTDFEKEGSDKKTDLDATIGIEKAGHTRTYSFSSDAKKQHDFCIFPSWAEYTAKTDSSSIKYQGVDQETTKRAYYLPEGQEIDNKTTTVPLKVINASETRQLDYELLDSGGRSVSGAVCRIDRKFPGKGTTETINMFRTGANGESRTRLQVNKVSYRHICFKDGSVFAEFPSQTITDPTILRKGEDTSAGFLSYTTDFDASCSRVGNTTVDCEYASDTADLREAKLEIFKQRPVTDTKTCSKTSESQTGELRCESLNISKHNYEFKVKGVFPESTVVGDSGFLGTASSNYGVTGVAVTVMLVIFVFLATSWNTVLGVGLSAVVYVGSSMMNFMPLTPTQKASLIGIVVLVAAVVSKRRGL